MVVRLAIFFVLFVASTLKLWLLFSNDMADLVTGFPKPIIFLVAIVELGIAVWNVLGVWLDMVYLANTILFSFFLVFDTIGWFIGHEYCSCFGPIDFQILHVAIFNAIVLTLLASSRSSRTGIRRGASQLISCWKKVPPSSKGIVTCLALFGAPLCYFFYVTNSQQQSPNDVVFANVKLDNPIELGEPTIGRIQIGNYSGETARIIGVKASCGCLKLKDQLAEIEANSIAEVEFALVQSKRGSMRQGFTFFLDHPKQFRLKILVLSEVR